ncbi:MFS transporter [Streptomyces oceani]|uniref:MFS transporter n=1 Tax=Streptomyces oceani TaxID=1075402 RepID=A0A1E7KKT5_9ACTN|nr:MFS transporter [Streptomyces oceani]OEV04622.1 MFS transporter [Streptomyces oceani]
MASPYRAIFAARGSGWFSAAGLLGRLPMSMTSVGIVAMVSQLTGRYALAGALSATVGLATALFSPQISRLVDRHGQRRVLPPAMLVAVASVTGLVLCARTGAPEWSLFLFAVTCGCTPSVGSMVRSRWVALYRDRRKLLQSAFAFEAVLDECCFVIGPILAIGLSTAWFPEAGPLLAGSCLLAGVLWLTAQHGTEPVPAPRGPHTGGSALRTPGLQVLVGVFVFTGAIFGSIDVVTIAFAEERGRQGAASLLLAGYALGSALAGVGFGLIRFTSPAAPRWLWGIWAMAVSLLPLQLVESLPALAGTLFLAGFTIAPTMVTTMVLVEQLVPAEALTEGMTWTGTGITVGMALGSSTAGWAVDTFGADRAYAVPLTAGALATAVAFLGYRRLRPGSTGGTVIHERTTGDEPTSVA